MSSSEEDEVKENLVEEAYQYLRRKSYPAARIGQYILSIHNILFHSFSNNK